MMKARQIAYQCLCDTMLRKQYASLNMRSLNVESEQDRSLITHIVYGTLRNYRYVRYQWASYVRKMPSKEIRVLLDMSTYQLLMLDKVPAYAVVNEAVEMAEKINGGSFSKLVNAVLHKIAENGEIRVNENDEAVKLAIETSHPDWLVKMWEAHYGKEVMEKIVWDDLKEGRLAMRANTFLTDEASLLKDEHFTAGKTPGSLYYEGNILNTAYFRDDLVIIQSESSQEVAQVVAPRKGDRILDMCSAPGTKGIQMAMMVHNDAEITAVDVHQHRIDLIEKALEKYGINCVKTMCADSRKLPALLPLHSFDKVLLDAPCSGLGTLKHKPEIKSSITSEDIDDIVILQQQLLEAASLMVANGGTLTYSTCTLNRKENDRQIKGFLALHPEFELKFEKTIFPFESDSDGFYIANMYKSMVE